ncbi:MULTISPECIES: hypothetical protein [Microcoleaceae]|uniref:hypothetical protein n=1 Tax=Microcoleaceae TaxID=1892252 RepID=UPI00187E959D|nr:hypothetical protein [Tychonema sp. LEGE 06208]MBE9164032.1 hypothetical protein [Tychonema sp. LEGE 06208]
MLTSTAQSTRCEAIRWGIARRFLAKAIARPEAQTARLVTVYLVGWGVSVQFLW